MRSSRLLALTALVWLLNAALACATSLTLTGAGSGSPASTPVFAGLGINLQSDAGVFTDSTLNTTDSTSFIYITVDKGQLGPVSGGVPNPITKTTLVGPALTQTDKTSVCEIQVGQPAPSECIADDNSVFFTQASFNNSVGAVHATDEILLHGDGVLNHTRPPGIWTMRTFSCNTVARVCAVGVNGVNMLPTPWSIGGTGVIPANMVPSFSANGLHFLNSGKASFGVGYGEFSLQMFDSQHDYVCTGVGAPATMTGLGAVTCAGASTFPPEFFAKIIASIPASPQAVGTGAVPADPGVNCTGYFGYTMSHCTVPGAVTPVADFLVEKGSATPAVGLAYQAVTTHGEGFASRFGPAGIPAHQVTNLWSTYQRFNGTAGSATISAAIDSNIISAGDFVVLLYQGSTNSNGSPAASAACPSDGNMWSQLFMRDTAANSAGNGYLACYGFPTTNLTGPFVATYSSNNVRNSSYRVLDYKHVASVDVACALFNTTAPAPHKTCSATTAAANETVLSAWFSANASTAAAPWNFPSSGFVVGPIARTPDNSDAQIMVGDTYAVASGANVQASATSFAGATGSSSFGLSISLVPN